MGESNLHDEVQSLRQRLADCEHSDEALRISQERLRVITDSVPVLISYIDNTFTYRFVNRGYERWFGMSRDELIGRRVPDVLDEAAFDRSKPYLDRVLAGEEVEFEGKAQNEDGSIKYFLTHCVPDRGDDGEVKGYFAVVSDISEVTTATLALRQSETRLRSVIEGIPLVLWATDAQGVFTLSEGRSLQRLGLSPGEVVGCSLFEVYADVPEVVSSARRALEGEAHSGTVRVAGLVFDVHYEPMIDASGEVSGLVGVASDITDRTLIAEDLEASEQKYRELVEEINDVIYSVDRTGVITYVSPAMEPIAGYTIDEVLGRPFTQFVHEDDVMMVSERFARVIDGAAGQLTELRILTKAGDVVWMETTSRPVIRSGQVSGVRGVLVDVTERRRNEHELSRLERLRVLGEMSAGVSHNLNNILVGILGPADLLRATQTDPEVTRAAEEILAAGERARELVQRLGRTVRGERDSALQAVKLNQHIHDVVRMARPRWKDDAEARGITIELVEDLGEIPPIAASASEMDELLMNLIFNAVDAMPAGGVITLRTRAGDGVVLLEMVDTGVGMEEETQQRLFEPFFTTKTKVGSGLGLSTVFGSITRWGGTIDVDSTPDEGTTFHLHFPLWQETESLHELHRGSEIDVRRATLLIIDDDVTTGRVLSRVFSSAHHVEVCTGSQEALSRFAPGRFDVAFIDLGMPGMPGDRVARELRRIDPLLATVLITGWDLSIEDPRLSAFDLRLSKPFGDMAHVTDTMARAVALRDRRAAARTAH